MTHTSEPSDLGAALGGTVYTAFLHLWFPIGIIAFLLYGAPRFERAFMNVDVPMPEATRFVLDLSMTVRANLPRIIGAVAIFQVLDATVYFLLRRSVGTAAGSIWSGIILFGQVGCAIFCVLSMLLPVSPLGEGLRSAWLP